MEQEPNGCDSLHVEPKVHHLKKSSGTGYGCMPGGNDSSLIKPVASKRQHGYPRSSEELKIDDLAVVARPQVEDVEEEGSVSLRSKYLK